MGQDLPTFTGLRRRFADGQDVAGHRTVSLASRVSPGSEAHRVLSYLAAQGCRVRTPDELLAAIDSLQDEEELSAVRCRDGIAVGHASDGWWLLFTA